MGMATLVTGFAQAYTDLGISVAIIHRQDDATEEELSSLYWLNLFTGFVAFAAVWSCSPLITSMFGEPRLLPLLRVVDFVFLITPIGKQFEILLEKDLKFNMLAGQEIAASVAGFVVAVACAVYGFGVWALVLSLLVTAILKTALLLGVGLARYRPHFHFRRSDLRGYIAFGLYQLGERTVNFASEKLDQVLIGSMLGAQALGFYNFAFNMTAQPIWRINPIITRVAFPVFARMQHDTAALRRGYLRLTRVVATINAPLLLGLAAVAPLAVPLIFGAKWAPSVVLIQILSFVALWRSTGNPIGSLQLAKGRPDLGFKWNCFLFVVSIPTIYTGIKVGGVIGVVVSLLLLQTLLQVPAYRYFLRPLIGACAREYAVAIFKPIASACVMALVVIALPRLFQGWPHAVELSAQVMLGACVYICLLLTFQRQAADDLRLMILSR